MTELPDYERLAAEALVQANRAPDRATGRKLRAAAYKLIEKAAARRERLRRKAAANPK